MSDRSGTIASPVTVVLRSGDRATDHAKIAQLVVEEEAEVVVVGLPLSLDGSVGPAARAAIEESAALATVVSVPVETFDERLTTTWAGSGIAVSKRRPSNSNGPSNLSRGAGLVGHEQEDCDLWRRTSNIRQR